MDVKIDNADICLDSSGNTVMISGRDELLQRIKFCLTVKKGSFVYNKELGANIDLSLIDTQKGLKNIEAHLNEAVMSVEGVRLTLKSAERVTGGVCLKLIVSLNGEDFQTEVII